MVPRSQTLSRRNLELLLDARELIDSGEARRLRERAGLSQRQAAALVGVTHAAVGRWERRKRRARGGPGLRYARFLMTLVEREAATEEKGAA